MTSSTQNAACTTLSREDRPWPRRRASARRGPRRGSRGSCQASVVLLLALGAATPRRRRASSTRDEVRRDRASPARTRGSSRSRRTGTRRRTGRTSCRRPPRRRSGRCACSPSSSRRELEPQDVVRALRSRRSGTRCTWARRPRRTCGVTVQRARSGKRQALLRVLHGDRPAEPVAHRDARSPLRMPVPHISGSPASGCTPTRRPTPARPG